MVQLSVFAKQLRKLQCFLVYLLECSSHLSCDDIVVLASVSEAGHKHMIPIIQAQLNINDPQVSLLLLV